MEESCERNGILKFPAKQAVAEDASSAKESLWSHLSLLRAESTVLDRIVHKGKNQHRRCHYFKSVLKVRRDLKLLLSAGMEEIFGYLFRVIDGSKPEQRLRALQGLKKTHVGGKHNHHERLLGVARLLSQMTEPLLVAAGQISALLAHSFFMGYSLIILSLLARMRVLLQQILLHSVNIYNQVSRICQEKHVVKLVHDGTEAYREYHPPCKEFLLLNYTWEGDKFVLHEEVDKSFRREVDENNSLEVSTIVYDIVEAASVGKRVNMEQGDNETAVELVAHPPSHPSTLEVELHSGEMETLHFDDENKMMDGNSQADSVLNAAFLTKTSSLPEIECSHKQNAPASKVAYVSVKRGSSPCTDESRSKKKARMKSHSLSNNTYLTDESDDPFFRLLTAGSKDLNLL